MEIDILNDKLITVEISGDEITINILRAAPTTYDALTDTPNSKVGSSLKIVRVNSLENAHIYGDIISSLGELTESANIAIDCLNHEETHAYIVDMIRIATTLTFSNFGKVFSLSMTKNNSDLGLVFTLAGTGLVFDVFDSANNIFTRATTVTISGTDANNSWALIFDDTGILSGTDKIIQVTGSISAFA